MIIGTAKEDEPWTAKHKSRAIVSGVKWVYEV